MTDSVSTDDATSDTAATAKPIKEVPVVIDEGYFKHHTGDTYEGFFEAIKKSHVIKMRGHGVYKTAEGDIYKGVWENDKLAATEEVTIEFVDGSAYCGPITNWCFSGSGKYTYPDNSVLRTDFADNCPQGPMNLLDPNGHQWLGKAELGFGWLDPINHFYTILEKRESKVRRRRKSYD